MMARISRGMTLVYRLRKEPLKVRVTLSQQPKARLWANCLLQSPDVPIRLALVIYSNFKQRVVFALLGKEKLSFQSV